MRRQRNKLIYMLMIASAFISVFSSKAALGADNKLNDCNLIIISINNIGAEHMSLYGYKRKTTPNIDKWASGAFVFENAFSPASWTLPVTTSVFTSLFPYAHKVLDRYHGNLLDKNIKTLPAILKGNNYKTAAFTGGLDYIKSFGHMQDFQDSDDNPPFTGFDVTLRQAKDWLSRNSDKKFFLFVQGYTAHPPFTPPKRFKRKFSHSEGKKITVANKFVYRAFKNSEGKYLAAYYMDEGKQNKVILTQDDIDYLTDLYDEEILYVDEMVGDFLKSIDSKLIKKTIVVIFSEHGEMFAKHGRFGRTGPIRGTLYDDVVQVPLIIKFPGAKGRKVEGMAQLTDIMPTILDILDIPLPGKTQGRSLLPLINENNIVNEYVYAGTKYNVGRPKPSPFYSHQSINESIRNHKWKLIHEVDISAPAKETFELYDLQNDPNEYINVADKYPGEVRDLKQKLDKWSKDANKFVPASPSTHKFPKDLIEDARKHGYW